MDKKGFTLLELVVGIAIIAILSLLIIPNLLTYLNNANESVDISNVRLLNQSTALYRIVENVQHEDTFAGLLTNEERQNELILYGYLPKSVPTRSNEYSIDWNIELQLWTYSKFEYSSKNNLHYIFTTGFDMSSILRGRDSNNTNNNWTLTENGLVGHQGSVLLENANQAYSIETIVKMNSISSSGGVGIYVETAVTNDGALYRDSGYIVQFDRGYGNGEIVVRKRTDSSESSPIARSTIGVENKNDNPTWWTQEQNLVVDVRIHPDNPSKKLLDVYINGTKSISNLEIDANSDSNQNFTGVRGWSQPVTVKEIKVIEN